MSRDRVLALMMLAYPSDWRHHNGSEIVETLRASLSDRGLDRLPRREALALLIAGMQVRACGGHPTLRASFEAVVADSMSWFVGVLSGSSLMVAFRSQGLAFPVMPGIAWVALGTFALGFVARRLALRLVAPLGGAVLFGALLSTPVAGISPDSLRFGSRPLTDTTLAVGSVLVMLLVLLAMAQRFRASCCVFALLVVVWGIGAVTWWPRRNERFVEGSASAALIVCQNFFRATGMFVALAVIVLAGLITLRSMNSHSQRFGWRWLAAPMFGMVAASGRTGTTACLFVVAAAAVLATVNPRPLLIMTGLPWSLFIAASFGWALLIDSFYAYQTLFETLPTVAIVSIVTLVAVVALQRAHRPATQRT